MLPHGFTSRSATIDDADAIYRLMAAGEIRWHGQAEIVPDRVAADLQRPELDLSRDTLVVEAATGDLAGSAWIHRGKRAQIDVHPSYQGLGIGTALLDWAEGRSREEGSEWLAQTVDDADKAGTDLVRSRGYEVLATNWLLERPITAPEPRTLPPGISLSPYDEARAHAVHELIEAAFGEFQQRQKPYDEWAKLTVERPTFRPNASTLAYAGDELIGAVIAFDLPETDEGYVEQLAVRSDQRGKGVARAMLDDTCAEFHRLGRRDCILWTHSGTGALGMYERLGMRVRRSTTVYRSTR
ncbi:MULTISPECIES: GNAT family N-acetyltransferase [unclassified Kribbella]|uniref:GNAT family N-acetyltransferase n=1 Tax=unclassified Kribbella TaxID=2644121 RepID=UPI00301A6BFB